MGTSNTFSIVYGLSKKIIPYVGEKFLFLGFKKGFELQRFLNLKLITIINKRLDYNNKVIELHVYIGLQLLFSYLLFNSFKQLDSLKIIFRGNIERA